MKKIKNLIHKEDGCFLMNKKDFLTLAIINTLPMYLSFGLYLYYNMYEFLYIGMPSLFISLIYSIAILEKKIIIIESR